MSQETITTLIGVLPQVLLIAILGAVLFALRKPLLENVLPRVSRVSVIGFQVELQAAEIRKALAGQAGADRPIPTDAAIGSIGVRARRNADAIHGKSIVWIDDHPEWTQAERLVLHACGLFVEPVRSGAEASAILDRGLAGRSVDLLLSDIGMESGGSRLDEVMALKSKHKIPVILYVGNERPGVPAGAFGLTSNPEELWHLVMDALERAEPNQAG